MLINSYRVLAIPLWTIGLAAFALSAPSDMRLSLIALLWLSLIVSTMPTMVQWLRPSRPLVEVLPSLRQNPAGARSLLSAGARARTLEEVVDAREADKAADLFRMDDDGGRPFDAFAQRPSSMTAWSVESARPAVSTSSGTHLENGRVITLCAPVRVWTS
jgi:hypothetical protein